MNRILNKKKRRQSLNSKRLAKRNKWKLMKRVNLPEVSKKNFLEKSKEGVKYQSLIKLQQPENKDPNMNNTRQWADIQRIHRRRIKSKTRIGMKPINSPYRSFRSNTGFNIKPVP